MKACARIEVKDYLFSAINHAYGRTRTPHLPRPMPFTIRLYGTSPVTMRFG